MSSIDLVPGLIMGFREGLEAFLIISIMLEFLNKIRKTEYKKYVHYGLYSGIGASLVFGLILYGFTFIINQNSNTLSKLWESVASFAALILITTFIYWMINHGRNMVSHVENKVSQNISKLGLVFLAAVMVAREGVEIALFVFAATEKSSYIVGTFIGIFLSAILVYLIYKSLVKVNLRVIFNVTLVYLILQAGFMLGYSIHEFLSYLKATGVLNPDSLIFTKAFNLSDTVLNHKEGVIGIPLYVLVGWYSKPEVIQFLLHLSFDIFFLGLWYKTNKR